MSKAAVFGPSDKGRRALLDCSASWTPVVGQWGSGTEIPDDLRSADVRQTAVIWTMGAGELWPDRMTSF